MIIIRLLDLISYKWFIEIKICFQENICAVYTNSTAVDDICGVERNFQLQLWRTC